MGASYPPETFDGAVQYLLDSLSREDKDALRQTPASMLKLYRHTLVKTVHNCFGLWGQNEVLLTSISHRMNKEFVLPEAASMQIVYGAWQRLQED